MIGCSVAVGDTVVAVLSGELVSTWVSAADVVVDSLVNCNAVVEILIISARIDRVDPALVISLGDSVIILSIDVAGTIVELDTLDGAMVSSFGKSVDEEFEFLDVAGLIGVLRDSFEPNNDFFLGELSVSFVFFVVFCDESRVVSISGVTLSVEDPSSDFNTPVISVDEFKEVVAVDGEDLLGARLVISSESFDSVVGSIFALSRAIVPLVEEDSFPDSSNINGG